MEDLEKIITIILLFVFDFTVLGCVFLLSYLLAKIIKIVTK